MATNEKKALTPVFSLLESAIAAWWKNLPKFLMIYVWGLLFAALPTLLALVFLWLGLASGLSSNLVFKIVVIFIAAWAFLFALYYLFRIYLSLLLLVKHDYVGTELKIYQKSAHYFWSYLALAFLTMIIMLLWFLALVIPAFIFGVFYSLAVYAFIFEDKRDIDALRRSQELVKGYWWPVFGRILFLAAALWLLMYIMAWPLNFMAAGSALAISWRVLIETISYLIGPVSLLFSYKIYQDLVKIKSN